MVKALDKALKMLDAKNKYIEQAIKWIRYGKSSTEIIFGLQRMGLTPVDASKYYAEAKFAEKFER